MVEGEETPREIATRKGLMKKKGKGKGDRAKDVLRLGNTWVVKGPPGGTLARWGHRIRHKRRKGKVVCTEK